MLRDAIANARFFAALSLAAVAHLCQDYVARQDERAASAINGPEDELP